MAKTTANLAVSDSAAHASTFLCPLTEECVCKHYYTFTVSDIGVWYATLLT